MVVVLIDGPSGSGKTDLAGRVAAGWAGPVHPQLVHLDDIYPGWDGLDLASEHVVSHVLAPYRGDGEPRWRRWDWARDAPAEWNAVHRDRPLIVEGCGAMSREAVALADIAVWVETDDIERKRRALQRDGELYAREWERWERQWRRFVARERPRELATVVVPT